MNYWKLRAVSILLMLILTASSIMAGYLQDISPEEASSLYNEATSYFEGLVVNGDVEATAFNMLRDFIPVVLVCNAPFVGPFTAIYTAYSAGYTAKAERIATGNDTFASLFLDPANILQLLAIALAGGEGVLLSYVFWRKEKVENLETLAVIILEMSLTILSVVFEAFEALF